jgi:4'-phosphopantetheinyl transferase
MIDVYLAAIEQTLPDSTFAAQLRHIPAVEREKIIRLQHWQDRQAALFGKLLLKKALIPYSALSLNQLQYTSYQKPFIEGVNFNISHTTKCVGCVISHTHRVGIDMECVTTPNLDDFRDCFDNHEWKRIVESPNPYQTFFSYWTKKEAAIKADGRGLSLDLKNIRVEDNAISVGEQRWFMTAIPFRDDHIIHIATDSEISLQQIGVHTIDFSNYSE